jgi:hypothetical protein
MAISTINTVTFISDTVIQLRDTLSSNITDPISSSRSAGEKFVMTGYPQRLVKYPIVTVQNTNIDSQKLGMQSELLMVRIPIEIRVWARNQKEKDFLTQEVMNHLRGIEFDSDGTVKASLIDFGITSAVNVDEDGQNTPKSRVITVEYKYILGT